MVFAIDRLMANKLTGRPEAEAEAEAGSVGELSI